MRRLRSITPAIGLACSLVAVTGCEQHFFKPHGVISSSGGQLFAWSRPVQGCSPDPLDGEPAAKSATLFTLYWDNPEARQWRAARHNAASGNKLQRLEVSRGADGLTGLLKTTLIDKPTVLDSKVCSTFKATTSPGKPVISGGRPTVDGTLDLDCQVADSHVTASIRFTGCEY